jgi:thiosulfate/3-mercaptopyruvate sulfurtransferase
MPPEFRALISVEELSEFGDSPDLVVVDCRFSLTDRDAGERSYRAGHVPGALYAHLERDLSAPVVPSKTGRHPLPDPDVLAARLGALGLDETRQLVAYDDTGGTMAARLWWLARWLGHDRAAVLDGGYPAWTRAGRPVSTDMPTPRPRRFHAKLRPELVASADDVDAERVRTDRRLLDARAPERYRGEVEPIDPVAGHIPGARSLPTSGNLADGHFREPEALRRRFDIALGGVLPEHTIVYCGSGVTACHDVLAALHAGIDGLRVYPGSWSEWITVSSRPIATGDEAG